MLTRNVESSTGNENEATCRAALRDSGVFGRADILESWPLSSAEVVSLLNGAEYVIDDDALHDLAHRGFLTIPRNGRWSAAGLCQLTGVLEALRLWKPFSEIHAAKKTEPQKLLEQIRADGEVAKAVGMFPKRSLRFALLLMTECQDRQMREQLLCHVKLQLDHDHGVFLE